MKKKIIIIIGVFAAAALLALPNILNAVREQKDAKKYDNAFNELFVTEKNAVAGLYTAIGNTIATPGSTYEKKKEIEKFFKSLSLLNNDMDLTDLTKH